MFALPFPSASFDVATSFNGIWKGCEAALSEARRVLIPGGRLGLTFWGRFEHLGLLPYFLKVIELSPPGHGSATTEQGDTQNVIEDMLTATGFDDLETGTVNVVNEWPDIDIAVRALASAGPSVPAIQATGLSAFCDALRSVLEPMHVPGVGIRITSEFAWVTARSSWPSDPPASMTRRSRHLARPGYPYHSVSPSPIPRERVAINAGLGARPPPS